ncbi:MAG: SpoIIE family protein phosphatase, partial [Lachnospiraceae bacterium]|nr:SpoIIE family protein phosphatase [Lachnospiraceae bacterium]
YVDYDFKIVKDVKTISSAYLIQMKDNYEVTEMSAADENGIILASTNPDRVGYDLKADEDYDKMQDHIKRSSIYMGHVDEIYDEEGSQLAYIEVALPEAKGLLQIGLDMDSYLSYIDMDLYRGVYNRHVSGDQGLLMVCEADGYVLYSLEGLYDGENIDEEIIEDMFDAYDDEELAVCFLGDVRYYTIASDDHGYCLAAFFPIREANMTKGVSIIMLSGVFVAVLFLVYIMLTFYIRRNVISSVQGIHRSLGRIVDGDLKEKVDERGSKEFSGLSDGINKTVDRLEELIDEETKRLDNELKIAKTIQKTSLPGVFPPFPMRKEFGLFATMDTAKEVGGDFYDFYLISDDKLAILIADVSDKGIPAAMFMMRAKTTITANAARGLHVNEVVDKVNKALVKENEAGMFVTLWMGFIDLKTGVTEYVHAGHTRPVLLRHGEAEYLDSDIDFVVGCLEDAEYKKQEFTLEPEDTLFLYTDGVTEAFNTGEELYGSLRLQNIIRKTASETDIAEPNAYSERICDGVRQDVAEFTAGNVRSDDMTMLCFKFKG